jgi:inhibitor of cysteine peptidase
MKKILVAIVSAILMLSFALTGCATEVKAFTDSNQVINNTLNNEFTIALDANLTTGYSWQPVFDEQAISLVEEPTFKENANTSKGIVGAGGTQYFKFKALKKGETQITFTYKRPWEPVSSTDQRQVFTIKVQ